MPLDLAATRHGPVEQPAGPGGLALVRLPPAARFILRCRPNASAWAAGAARVELPLLACRAAMAGKRSALWLGPDEWLLLAPVSDGAELAAALARAAEPRPYSLVDVSHRQVGIGISGTEAAAALSVGCPLDLDPDAFPPGTCTRTVLGKSEIVLWRTAQTAFHLEVWRSFAPYAWELLEEALREFRG